MTIEVTKEQIKPQIPESGIPKEPEIAGVYEIPETPDDTDGLMEAHGIKPPATIDAQDINAVDDVETLTTGDSIQVEVPVISMGEAKSKSQGSTYVSSSWFFKRIYRLIQKAMYYGQQVIYRNKQGGSTPA